MEQQTKSESGTLSALSDLMGRVRNMQPAAALASAYTRLRHGLTGTDPDLLAQCPRNEWSFHHAMALAMLLAAVITATGLAPKLGAMWGIGTVLSAVVWLGVFTLVLALETLMLNSIQAGVSASKIFMVRIPIALMLVGLQVIPASTTMLRERIALELHDQSVNAQLQLSDKQKTLLNVAGMAADGKKLDEAVLRSLAEQATPPQDMAVQTAAAQLAKAEGDWKRAEGQHKAAGERVRKQQTAVANATTPEAKARLEPALTAAFAARSTAQKALNTADGAVANAKTDVGAAQTAQTTRLQAAVDTAKQTVGVHAKKVTDADAALNAEAATAKKLADAASTANFATEVMALGKLMFKEPSVLATILGLLAAFGLLDLVPTIMKAVSRNSVYNSLMSHARFVMDANAEANQAVLADQLSADAEVRKQATLLRANQTLGIAQFAKEDNGSLDMQLALVDKQLQVDEARFTMGVAVTEAGLRRLDQMLDVLIAANDKAKVNPDVELAYRSQLEMMMADIGERLGKLRAKVGPMGAGSASAQGAGT